MWDSPGPCLPRACLYYFRSAVCLFWQLNSFNAKSKEAGPRRVSQVPASVLSSCSSLSYRHPGLSTLSLLVGGRNDELKNQSRFLLSNILWIYKQGYMDVPDSPLLPEFNPHFWVWGPGVSFLVSAQPLPLHSQPTPPAPFLSPSVQTLYLLQSLAEVSVAMTPFLLTNPGLWGSVSFEPTLYPTPCVGRHVITALTENLLFPWINSVFFNKLRTIFKCKHKRG